MISTWASNCRRLRFASDTRSASLPLEAHQYEQKTQFKTDFKDPELTPLTTLFLLVCVSALVMENTRGHPESRIQSSHCRAAECSRKEHDFKRSTTEWIPAGNQDPVGLRTKAQMSLQSPENWGKVLFSDIIFLQDAGFSWRHGIYQACVCGPLIWRPFCFCWLVFFQSDPWWLSVENNWRSFIF